MTVVEMQLQEFFCYCGSCLSDRVLADATHTCTCRLLSCNPLSRGIFRIPTVRECLLSRAGAGACQLSHCQCIWKWKIAFFRTRVVKRVQNQRNSAGFCQSRQTKQNQQKWLMPNKWRNWLPIRPTCHTITTFTCQATVRKNDTACSDVIIPFGLHVWKSFTCGRRVS